MLFGREGRLVDQSIKATALLMLTADQRKKLVALARVKARGSSLEPDDLLQEARQRWLKSDMPAEGNDATFDFLWSAVNSIASNNWRRQATVRRMEGQRIVAASAGSPDPVETAPDSGPSPEDTYLREQIYGLCEDDEVRTLLLHQDDGAPRAEILSELGWNVTKYETVKKRMKKWGARLFQEGKI
jgi:DNA-directed RNA polymerase specialized sigma24 family protein